MNNFNLIRFYSPVRNMTNEFFLAGFDDNGIISSQPNYYFASSYHILNARLVGLPYPDFLLWCVKNYNAELCGKRGYCYPVFKNLADCQKFCQMLDKKFKDFLKQSGIVDDGVEEI